MSLFWSRHRCYTTCSTHVNRLCRPVCVCVMTSTAYLVKFMGSTPLECPQRPVTPYASSLPHYTSEPFLSPRLPDPINNVKCIILTTPSNQPQINFTLVYGYYSVLLSPITSQNSGGKISLYAHTQPWRVHVWGACYPDSISPHPCNDPNNVNSGQLNCHTVFALLA